MASASIISSGTIVYGNVESDGTIEVLGRVEGAVTAEGTVVVGEAGSVGGNVLGSTVRVAGEVGGNLSATEVVYIESTGRVVGDSVAPRIGIADGALIRGHVRTEGIAPDKPVSSERPMPSERRARPLFQPLPPETANGSRRHAPPAPELPVLGRIKRATRRRRKEPPI